MNHYLTEISFKGVSISTMSIIENMIAKSSIDSNSGELQAM